MTVEKIMDLGMFDDSAIGLINDLTEIFIRKDFKVLAHGNWYQDHILDHMQDEVESFTWQDDNKIFIDVK